MQWQQVPKAELHLHLGGSFPKEFLFSLATPQQQLALENGIRMIEEGIDYSAAFQVFLLIRDIVNTEEKLKQGVIALCQSLKQDNVCYVEIRTGVKDLGQGDEECLKAVLTGINASLSDDFQAKVILSLQRSSTISAAQKTIDLALKYRNQGVVGIDISGDATIGQIETILPELVRAKEAGIPFVVHMGEVPDEPDQMLLLGHLEPKRIGHGVYLCDAAKEWIRERKIPIEVCLSSSVLVKMIDHDAKHPGLEFLRSSHPIAFCTDDPLLFSTSASKELWRAQQYCHLQPDELKQIIDQTFDYALMQESSF